MFIEIGFSRAETSHGYHQVSQCSFECFPIFNVVEQRNGKGFYPNFAQVCKQSHNAIGDQFNHIFLVAGILMSNPIFSVDGLLDRVCFNHSD